MLIILVKLWSTVHLGWTGCPRPRGPVVRSFSRCTSSWSLIRCSASSAIRFQRTWFFHKTLVGHAHTRLVDVRINVPTKENKSISIYEFFDWIYKCFTFYVSLVIEFVTITCHFLFKCYLKQTKNSITKYLINLKTCVPILCRVCLPNVSKVSQHKSSVISWPSHVKKEPLLLGWQPCYSVQGLVQIKTKGSLIKRLSFLLGNAMNAIGFSSLLVVVEIICISSSTHLNGKYLVVGLQVFTCLQSFVRLLFKSITEFNGIRRVHRFISI